MATFGAFNRLLYFRGPDVVTSVTFHPNHGFFYGLHNLHIGRKQYIGNCNIVTLNYTLVFEVSKKTGEISKQKILLSLSHHAEIPQSQMAQSTGLSNKTIIENLQFLKTNDYATFRTEPSVLGGKDKKFWSITFKGLVYVLNYLYAAQLKATKIIIKKIIKAQAQNMLVFKKWDLFVKAGLEGLLLDSLEKAFGVYTFHTISMSKSGVPPFFDNFAISHDTLTKMILTGPLITGKASKEYITFLKNDPELSALVDDSMNNLKREIVTRQKILEMWCGNSLELVP